MQSRRGVPQDLLLALLHPEFPKRGLTRHLAIPPLEEHRQVLQVSLRECLDAWVDSGFQADGSEERSSRKFKGEFREGIHDFLAEHPPVTSLKSDGSGVATPFMQRPDFAPEHLARNFFMDFINDRNRRFEIMRCRGCREFRFPANPKPKYAFGWFCSKCGLKRASTFTAIQREKNKAELNRRAAAALIEWEQKPRRTGKVDYVLAAVNKNRSLTKRVHRKTISRRLKDIEELVHTSGEKQNQQQCNNDQDGAFDHALIQANARALYVVSRG
jgi:hypothetical protein